MSSIFFPAAVLFDLDGTLLDTAPDLGDAANALRLEYGLTPLDDIALRPFASAGARGLIEKALQKTPSDPEFQTLKNAFLDYYANHIAVRTTLFPGISMMLDALEEMNIPWGIVTNKPHIYTLPLLRFFDLTYKSKVIISGDTTAYSKPHPEPLFEAARQLNIPAHRCWYIGDDLRDIQAAHAAHMYSIAAAYGYCGETPINTWNADKIIKTPDEITQLIKEIKFTLEA